MGCNSSTSTGTQGRALTAEEENAVRRVFHMCDTDKSGYLDQNEVHKFFAMYYQAQGKQVDSATIDSTSRAFMRQADKNHDNKIGLNEFLRHIKG